MNSYCLLLLSVLEPLQGELLDGDIFVSVYQSVYGRWGLAESQSLAFLAESAYIYHVYDRDISVICYAILPKGLAALSEARTTRLAK